MNTKKSFFNYTLPEKNKVEKQLQFQPAGLDLSVLTHLIEYDYHKLGLYLFVK